MLMESIILKKYCHKYETPGGPRAHHTCFNFNLSSGYKMSCNFLF